MISTTATNKCCVCGRYGSVGIIVGDVETQWFCIVHLNRAQNVTASITGLPPIKFPGILGDMSGSVAGWGKSK